MKGRTKRKMNLKARTKKKRRRMQKRGRDDGEIQ